jgi:hypothetical protein
VLLSLPLGSTKKYQREAETKFSLGVSQKTRDNLCVVKSAHFGPFSENGPLRTFYAPLLLQAKKQPSAHKEASRPIPEAPLFGVSVLMVSVR